jgi:hypothetical protein
MLPCCHMMGTWIVKENDLPCRGDLEHASVSLQCADALSREAAAWLQPASLQTLWACISQAASRATSAPEEAQSPRGACPSCRASESGAREGSNRLLAPGPGHLARHVPAAMHVAESAAVAFAAAVDVIVAGARLPEQACLACPP